MEYQAKLSNFEFSACIFDFDGVIIDSEPLHAEAKRITLEHYQIPFAPGIFDEFKGRPDRDFFEFVADQLALGRASCEEMESYKRQEYSHIFETVELVPGVVDFINAARKKYNRIGIATSATGRDFSLAAHKYQLDAWFDVIVTGADTIHHKPHPEPYLKAMSGLRVGPHESIAIEDSPIGILSAGTAGCTVAAIATSFCMSDLSRTGAHVLAQTYAELAVLLGFSA